MPDACSSPILCSGDEFDAGMQHQENITQAAAKGKVTTLSNKNPQEDPQNLPMSH